MVLGALSCVDYGDAPTVPGLHRGHARPHRGLRRGDPPRRRDPARASAATTRSRSPSCAGGAPCTARSASCTSTPTATSGTVLRPAVEPRHGLPARLRGGPARPGALLQAGMRGSLYGPEDYGVSRELGMRSCPGSAARARPGRLRRPRARRARRTGPVFFTFDVDFVDPAFCPGTGTPRSAARRRPRRSTTCAPCRGSTSARSTSSRSRRSTTRPGQVTALLAANVAYEMLSLIARARA